MSKETNERNAELVDDEEDGSAHQSFAYWANLMVTGDAPPTLCRYPSQSSVLARSGAGWQSLTEMHPPTVELLDDDDDD
jgi:hypothetical protein